MKTCLSDQKKTMKKKTKKKYVIVRSYTAGVHAGYLESIKKDQVVLTQSIRLWRWYGASLSQVAVTGPTSGDNRFGMPVTRTAIISPQGFEIAECTNEAMKAIQGVPSWKV